VRLNAGADYLIRIAGWADRFADFTLSISQGASISNETCQSAQYIPPGRFIGTADTTWAALEPGTPPGACNNAVLQGLSHSVWYKFVPGAGGPLSGTVDSTSYDQLVVVLAGACGSFVELACIDAQPANIANIPVIAGQTYYLGIGSFDQEPGGVSAIDITIPSDSSSVGACCRGAACTVATAGSCTGIFNRFAGVGTACNLRPDNIGVCCRADFNHLSGISVQDIFDFLNAYFGGNGMADINGAGLSVQDIFDYLGAYFAGCH
jgi:hypothetical protein